MLSTKICTKCKLEKNLEEFYNRKQVKSGKRPACKSCSDLETKNWSKLNPERIKLLFQNQTWKKRGIDVEEANKIKEKFSSCYLCQSELNLNIDHCHETSKIRGVLCRNCNLGLGLFKDNSAVLRKAADYIDKNNKAVYN